MRGKGNKGAIELMEVKENLGRDLEAGWGKEGGQDLRKSREGVNERE